MSHQKSHHYQHWKKRHNKSLYSSTAAPCENYSLVKMRRKIRVMSYNIMRDDQKESRADLRWVTREDKIVALILDVQPDIFCLQECRDLPLFPFSLFVDRLAKLGYDCSIHHDTRLPRLRVATFWVASKFSKKNSKTQWANPQYEIPRGAYEWYGQKSARPIGFDTLEHISSQKTILICNTHFGHHPVEKLHTAGLLVYLLHAHNFMFPSDCIILCSDANFFSDKQGYEHRQQLLMNYLGFQLQDLTFNASLIASGCKPLVSHTIMENPENQKLYPAVGTFVGSYIDNYKPSQGSIGDALDIIAGYNIELIGSWVWNKTMHYKHGGEPPVLHNSLFPSDHLPLVVDIMLGNNNKQEYYDNKFSTNFLHEQKQKYS